MITTHPSIMIGSYALDEDRLPRDEFDIRLAPHAPWAATLVLLLMLLGARGPHAAPNAKGSPITTASRSTSAT